MLLLLHLKEMFGLMLKVTDKLTLLLMMLLLLLRIGGFSQMVTGENCEFLQILQLQNEKFSKLRAFDTPFLAAVAAIENGGGDGGDRT